MHAHYDGFHSGALTVACASEAASDATAAERVLPPSLLLPLPAPVQAFNYGNLCGELSEQDKTEK